MNDSPHPLQIAGSLLIDFFRWSQLAPMITLWFFALVAVAMLLFVNHQEQAWDGIESVTEWVVELPVVGPAYLGWLEEQASSDGRMELHGEDFERMAMWAWAVLSLAFMVIGWAANALFGPFRPWTLKRKLLVAVLACAALMAGFVGTYALSPEQFNGPTWRWVLTFGGMSLIVLLASGWCLGIAHALGLLSRWLRQARFGRPAAEDELI
jgi:magnesium-transporting ATPase (P-type)